MGMFYNNSLKDEGYYGFTLDTDSYDYKKGYNNGYNDGYSKAEREYEKAIDKAWDNGFKAGLDLYMEMIRPLEKDSLEILMDAISENEIEATMGEDVMLDTSSNYKCSMDDSVVCSCTDSIS